MKNSVLSLIALSSLLNMANLFAHEDRVKRCHYEHNRRGDRVKVCTYKNRRHNHRRHHDNDLSDLEAGVIIGAGAVILAQNCAPTVLDSNVVVTDDTLLSLLSNEKFATESKFNEKVSAISAETDIQKKMSQYFALVGVSSYEDVAHFIGARDEDMPKYVDALQKSTGLNKEKAAHVVSLLSTSLKSNMN